MTVRDMILTPIMCFGGYKINWEWIGTVWKNNTFLCAENGQWPQPGMLVATAWEIETSGRGH